MFKLDVIAPSLAQATLGNGEDGFAISLPICPIEGINKYILAFDSMGDMEVITNVAKTLVAAYDFTDVDVIVCPEAKAIPIAQELSRLLGINYYVLRKAKKAYMTFPVSVKVNSITTRDEQHLWYDVVTVSRKLDGKRVMLFDDVVSTGASFNVLESFAYNNHLNVVHKVVVFKEGDSKERDDIKALGYLPVFTNEDFQSLFR